MSFNFAEWYPAEECTDGPGSGAKALMSYLLDEHSHGENWGIYNCRAIVGGSTTSAHGEGRALDIGMPKANDGEGSALGYEVVEHVGEYAAELGVMAIIYDRRIWSRRSPDGRLYTGRHPHFDHVHIELTREAAAHLTKSKIRSIMRPHQGSSYEMYKEDAEPGDRTIGQFKTRPWSAGDDVEDLQRVLNAWYPSLKALERDGLFGPKTTSRVRYLQKRAGVTVDGIVGPVTWGVIGY